MMSVPWKDANGVKGFEMKLKIRPIIKEDLEVLNKKLKSEYVPTLHEDKLKEQEQGGSVWLIWFVLLGWAVYIIFV